MLTLHISQGLASNLWTWVPPSSPPLQQDHTSFSATFPQAPRIFPTAIPNSTRSSVFAHSTGPGRSVHWPSDLDAPPTTSWATPWSNSYCADPYLCGNASAAYSHMSLGGVRGFSTGTVPGTAYTTCPPMPPSPYMGPTPSNPSPVNGPFVPHSSHSPAHAVPTVESHRLQCTASSPQPASTPSQTESVVGSMRRTRLSTITESRTPSPAIPPLPAFGRTPLSGPSPSTSTTETFSTPSGPNVGGPRPGLLTSLRVPGDLMVPNDPTRQTWIDVMYPSETSSNASSISLPSLPRVNIPPLHPVEAVQWSSLFPSAPVVIGRPAPEGDSPDLTRVSSLDESNASPLLSPARSVISYVDSPSAFPVRMSSRLLLIPPFCLESSSLSEPMTPLSHMSGESTPGAVPNKLTTDIVGHLKGSNDSVQSAADTTAVASASNVPSSSTPPRNHLATQLVSFFFDSVQRIFKVPASVDLSYNGFEVTFSTASVPWNDDSVPVDDGDEHGRTFEIMPAPSNAALHRYIRDLARVSIDLAAMPANGDKSTDQAIEQLVLRVKAEQEATQKWTRRVCVAAGALSIADPAFSPRK